jgi:hypothetical protein
MATKKTPARKQVPTGPLSPVVVKNETQAMDYATQSGRKRPFVAINDDGKLVVCSRRTAAKYGWESQGALYSRNGTAPVDKPSKQAKVAPWDKPAKQSEPTPTGSVTRAVRRAVRAEFAALTGRNRK